MVLKKLIVVAGPTCVGKTSYAIELALANDAEIFSADSRQVYKEMSIGTAKPSHLELNQVKHHLIDHVSVSKQYNVGDYERDVITLLDEYYKTHDVAILCGGTGLYIDAILNGLDDFPEIEPSIRQNVNDQLANEGLTPLQVELQLKDPEYYNKVDINNPRRISRAVEVIRQSGLPYSAFLTSSNVVRSFYPEGYILSRNRDYLYDRINKRVDQMIDGGLIEEVKSLQPYKSNTSLNTVGYQEIFKYLDGEITLDRAIELIKQNSRRYAKRQMTWFRKKTDWTAVYLDATY